LGANAKVSQVPRRSPAKKLAPARNPNPPPPQRQLIQHRDVPNTDQNSPCRRHPSAAHATSSPRRNLLRRLSSTPSASSQRPSLPLPTPLSTTLSILHPLEPSSQDLHGLALKSVSSTLWLDIVSFSTHPLCSHAQTCKICDDVKTISGVVVGILQRVGLCWC